MVAVVLATHLLEKVFVVRDDNQLEVRLHLSCLDDLVQAPSQGLDVIAVEVGRWFV